MTAMESEGTGKETLVREIDPESYFEVRGRLWDPKEEDYTLVSTDEIGSKKFRDVVDAIKHFHQIQHGDFPSAGKSDLKLDLLHLRFGHPQMVKSRILFPSA